MTVCTDRFCAGAYHGNERVMVNLRTVCPACEVRQKFGKREKKTHLIVVMKYMGDKGVW